MRHTHEVILSPHALEDLDKLHAYIAIDAPARADSFLSSLERKIESLRSLPDRHARAREGNVYGVPVRQFMVHPYRVLYLVLERKVYILRVGHGAQRTLELE